MGFMIGCSSIRWSMNGRCGPNHGHMVCHGKTRWCSKTGWCGNTFGHQDDNYPAYDFPEHCNSISVGKL